MNIFSLTFRDLQYLVALDKHRHFGKAAKECHVSQPAMSAQIKKIEGYFSKELFERQNKSIFPTPEGLQVIENARKILDEAKFFEELFQVKKHLLSSELKIGIIHTLSPYYPPYFITELKKRYPDLNLSIMDGYTDDLLLELKSGKIDVLIASEVFTDEQLLAYHLFDEPLYACVNRQHPLAQKEVLALNDLNAEQMYFLKDGNCLKDEAIDLCPKNRRGNIKEAYINSLETLKQMVAFNNSYAIIPALACDLPKSFENMMAIKKFQGQSKVTRKVSLFIRGKSARMEDYLAFLKVLKETLPNGVLK